MRVSGIQQKVSLEREAFNAALDVVPSADPIRDVHRVDRCARCGRGDATSLFSNGATASPTVPITSAASATC
jgi:hypothetical protein